MADFDDLVRALRDEHPGTSRRAPATRARIMMSLHERRHGRRVRWGFGVPLIVMLLGSVAWAGARGDLGPSARAAVHWVESWFEPNEEAEPVVSTGTRTGASQDAGEAQDEGELQGAEPDSETASPTDEDINPESEDESVSEPLPGSTLEPPPVEATSSKPAPNAAEKPQRSGIQEPTGSGTGPKAPPSKEPSLDPHLAVYRQAHDAQFAQNDCAAAVASYDRYLAAAAQDASRRGSSAGGSLVPEARFNRATCLVRLGRNQEAARALRPFAEGAYGDYRREDARRLLDVLDRR